MDVNKIKLSRNVARSKCLAETWDPSQAPDLTDESLKKLREGLRACLASNFTDNDGGENPKYTIDCLCGLALKEFFEKEENNWFSLRLAANDDFWAYLSIVIIPDLVYKRYEKSIDHYCWHEHRNRIWLKAIWWYTYLSWQGDTETTKKVLEAPALTTDSIVALVERPGRGMRVDFSRSLMKYVAQIDKEFVDTFKNNHTIKSEDGKKDKSTTIFRALMKANTALSAYIEPDLCKDGVDGYVQMLFKDFNLTVNLDTEDEKSTEEDNSETNNSTEENQDPADTENYDGDDEVATGTPVTTDVSPANPARINVIVDDITTLNVDAIVKSSTNLLLGGGGVDGAVHKVAGRELLTECRQIGGCETGKSVITEGYNLPARYIIHTVGPDCRDGSQRINRERLLRSCYNTSLDIVRERGFNSVAFCCISTGLYEFPKREAAQIAVSTIRQRLNDGLNCEVIICCYTDEDKAIYDEVMNQ